MIGKIKLSLINEDNREIDYITRSIPLYAEYNFSRGILIDLLTLLGRNQWETDLVEQIARTIDETG